MLVRVRDGHGRQVDDPTGEPRNRWTCRGVEGARRIRQTRESWSCNRLAFLRAILSISMRTRLMFFASAGSWAVWLLAEDRVQIFPAGGRPGGRMSGPPPLPEAVVATGM